MRRIIVSTAKAPGAIGPYNQVDMLKGPDYDLASKINESYLVHVHERSIKYM